LILYKKTPQPKKWLGRTGLIGLGKTKQQRLRDMPVFKMYLNII